MWNRNQEKVEKERRTFIRQSSKGITKDFYFMANVVYVLPESMVQFLSNSLRVKTAVTSSVKRVAFWLAEVKCEYKIPGYQESM